jgi:hypothetical protein
LVAVRSLLLALQLVIQPAAPPSMPTADDALRARADSAVRGFLVVWRRAWEDAQDEQSSFPAGFSLMDTTERILFVHCHFTTVRRSERVQGRVAQRAITGSVPAQAQCPTWYPSRAKPLDDERVNVDGGIAPKYRPRIRQLRNSVRRLIDSAARAFPRDVALTDQRVRFALDAQDTVGAVAAAAECAGEASRCSLLHGLVLYRLGLVASADSTFLAAAGQMADSVRCKWNDVSPLLDFEQRRSYAALSCAARAEFEARFWWLSDPLWLERGNERRAEHAARRVHTSIIAALGEDARHRYVPRKGGDAVIETIMRYGWPTQMYWPGLAVDRYHGEWLLSAAVDTAPPYIVMEYSRRNRLHTVPSASALAAPLRATRDSWTLKSADDDRRAWPSEHYARDASDIVQLSAGQSVMLRRRDSIRFAWAGDLDARPFGRTVGDTVVGTMFESRAADDIRGVGTWATLIGRALVVDASLRPGAALIGIEVPGDTGRPAARTRFAVDAMPPLSALGAARAISQPLLFDPPADAGRTMTADSAITRMYGSTTFERVRRIGLYWESYGFAATDTVEIEVFMSREHRPGFFERITAIFRSGEGGDQVGMRWREGPENRRAIRLRQGEVSLDMRAIVLDMSRLPRGSYRIQVSMSRLGEAVVSSEREFQLR